MLNHILTRTARLLLLTLVAGLLTACNLTNQQEVLPTNTPPPVISGRPTVTITAPQTGSEFQVEREILVTASATDDVGVTRVQLLANGQPVRTVLSENELGDRQKNIALGYTPRVAGEVRLSVVAYRGNTASDPAEISVRVVSQVIATATQATGGGGGGSGPVVPTIDISDPTCRARARTNLNMRQGPNVSFPVLRVLGAGETLPIIGRLGNNTWWQLRSGTTVGWVSADFTDVFGVCNNVPIVQPPVTPTVPATIAPTATIQPSNTPVPPPTSTPQPPDLMISSLTGPQNVTIGAGQTSVRQRYNLTVANIGGRASGEFDIDVTITNLTTGTSVPLNPPLAAVSNVRRNEAIALDFEVEFTAAGSYSIDVVLDPTNDVPELSEANNNALLRVTVTQQ